MSTPSAGLPADAPHLHAADGIARPPLRRENYADIPGWGSDLGRARHAGPAGGAQPEAAPRLAPRPASQAQRVEVLMSTERPAMPPVFGSSVPPRGVSGALRRCAFRYSENDLRHWLLLLFADRVDMVEGLFGDVARGQLPALHREMGLRAELRHNPAGTMRKALTVAVVGGLAWYWLAARRRR